jgi:transposase
MDEVGFSFLDKIATTWAPRGETPVLLRTSERRVLSTIIALTTDAKLLKRHFDHAITGADILVALRHFRRYLPGPLILIWDRLTAHRDRRVQQWIAADPDLYVEWLPPYAPDLNPEEGCNDNLKNAVRNAAPETVEELRLLVDRAFDRLRKRPDLLQAFFQHARLDGVNLIT